MNKEDMYQEFVDYPMYWIDKFVTLEKANAELEQRIAKAIEIASTMKSLDTYYQLMDVLEGK